MRVLNASHPSSVSRPRRLRRMLCFILKLETSGSGSEVWSLMKVSAFQETKPFSGGFFFTIFFFLAEAAALASSLMLSITCGGACATT